MTAPVEIRVDAIDPGPFSGLRADDGVSWARLKASVAEVGILKPIDVREVADGRYEVIKGERRLRAAREAGMATIPAVVARSDDDVAIRLALQDE